MKTKAPNQLIFEFYKSKIIPGCSPYKESQILRGKEIFPSDGFEEANNHAVMGEHWDRPEKGWPLGIGRRPSPRASEKKSPQSCSCKELNPANNQRGAQKSTPSRR